MSPKGGVCRRRRLISSVSSRPRSVRESQAAFQARSPILSHAQARDRNPKPPRIPGKAESVGRDGVRHAKGQNDDAGTTNRRARNAQRDVSLLLRVESPARQARSVRQDFDALRMTMRREGVKCKIYNGFPRTVGDTQGHLGLRPVAPTAPRFRPRPSVDEKIIRSDIARAYRNELTRRSDPDIAD